MLYEYIEESRTLNLGGRVHTEIGERLLGRARLALGHSQQVAHLDQQLPVALALERRQRQDARDVVVLRRLLLLFT